MVSFSCESCGDIISKKGLDKHRSQCRGASFSCLDCGVHFQGSEYKNHTSCVSEAQKVQGSLFKEKKQNSKADKRKSVVWEKETQEMVPRQAYVEDAPEGDDSQAVAVIDVPPKAPSPPPVSAGAVEPTEGVNVFDFLVTDETPNGATTPGLGSNEKGVVEHPVYYGTGDYSQYSQLSQYSNGHHPASYMQYGFVYGNTPVPPSYARYDSWQNLADSQDSYVTPAPKEHRKEKRDKDKRMSMADSSEKKRKRHQVEELDLSSAKRPSSRDQIMTDAPREERVLHSGLTGGLNKLVTDPEFYEDRIDAGPTPILSPVKRSRREEDLKKADRRKSSYASYSMTTTKPSKHASNERNDRKIYIEDDKYHRRSIRSPERSVIYHEHKPRRARSAERSSYHDDRHRHRHHHHHPHNGDSGSSNDRGNRKHLRVIEYPSDRSDRPERPASVQPNATNQMVTYSSRADLFLSFIQKGPDSERGCSINKVLKRYHRERDIRGYEKKDDEDKELWKGLRLRRNDRGEIVLFI